MGVGSNGFPGYSPAVFRRIQSRFNVGFYAELGADLSEDLFRTGSHSLRRLLRTSAAETVYKVAGRYSISENFGLRASFNAGFRAPTPGQQGTTNVSTRLPNGFPVAAGLFPAGGSRGASSWEPKALYCPKLQRTFNSASPAPSVTIDFTLDLLSPIDVADYFSAISTSGRVYMTQRAAMRMQTIWRSTQQGVSGANSIGGVFYFTNAYDRGVSGWDSR